MAQEMTKARPVIAVGNAGDGLTVEYADYGEATQAWLMLASMGIPAGLDAGLDGWLPNNVTTAWRKETPMDFRLVPDIKLEPGKCATMIYSRWMRCEFPVAHEKVYETIRSIIREWRDIIEADM